MLNQINSLIIVFDLNSVGTAACSVPVLHQDMIIFIVPQERYFPRLFVNMQAPGCNAHQHNPALA
jgi:hypothetical protein